jgi:hypothetical protein
LPYSELMPRDPLIVPEKLIEPFIMLARNEPSQGRPS